MLHIRDQVPGNSSIFLSKVFQATAHTDVSDKHIQAVLKLVVVALEYHTTWGISIDRIDTHSLRIGGANAQLFMGYSDRQIQKLGRW